MGLDSYWEVATHMGQLHPEFDPPLQLCGGLFSEHGRGSFRGKVYEDAILEVTGVSLYQEVIDADTIKAMAAKLDAFRLVEQGLEPDEARDMCRMFTTYAATDASLRGWW